MIQRESVDATVATKARLEVRGGTLKVNRGQANRQSLDVGPETQVVGRNEACDLVLDDLVGGTQDGKAIVKAIRDASPIDDPLFGKTTVRVDGRAIHDMYLVEVKKPEESKKPYDYYKLVATIPAERAFRPLADGGCPLVGS